MLSKEKKLNLERVILSQICVSCLACTTCVCLVLVLMA